FPFIHWISKQTFVQSTGNNKAFAKFITEFGRDNNSALRINVVLEFTHEHTVRPTFIFLYYHISPQFTTTFYKKIYPLFILYLHTRKKLSEQRRTVKFQKADASMAAPAFYIMRHITFYLY